MVRVRPHLFAAAAWRRRPASGFVGWPSSVALTARDCAWDPSPPGSALARHQQWLLGWEHIGQWTTRHCTPSWQSFHHEEEPQDTFMSSSCQEVASLRRSLPPEKSTTASQSGRREKATRTTSAFREGAAARPLPADPRAPWPGFRWRRCCCQSSSELLTQPLDLLACGWCRMFGRPILTSGCRSEPAGARCGLP